jgi:flagellar biosynthesis/type III secretory pathway protein FliH
MNDFEHGERLGRAEALERVRKLLKTVKFELEELKDLENELVNANVAVIEKIIKEIYNLR